jgi:hypothetical protein
LNRYFKSVYIEDSDNQLPNFEAKTSSVINDIHINLDDVEKKLSNLDVRKSIGPDSVHPYVLKLCSKAMVVPLFLIFKKSLA